MNTESGRTIFETVGLVKNLARQRRGEVNDGFERFFEEYISTFSAQDIESRLIEDIYGVCYSLWHLVQEFESVPHKLRVFNPELDSDGWLNSHTVISVLKKDIPYLLESLKIALTRAGYTIQLAKSSLIQSQREQGVLREYRRASLENEGEWQTEAMIYLEINRLTDAAEMDELKQDLSAVLDGVEKVAIDRYQGFERLSQLISEYARQSELPAFSAIESQLHESMDFLHWLGAGNFTLIGVSQYAVGEDGSYDDSGFSLGVLRQQAGLANTTETVLNAGQQAFSQSDQVLAFAKSSRRSQIKRGVFSDYVIAKRYNDEGTAIGEIRFLGVYQSSFEHTSPLTVPLLSRKVERLLEQKNLVVEGHEHRALRQLIETFPKQELMQASIAELDSFFYTIMRISERRQVKLLTRVDPFESYLSCLVYIPKDVYSTDLRKSIQALLQVELGVDDSDFNAYFSDAELTRLHVILPIQDIDLRKFNSEIVEKRLIQLALRWEDNLLSQLIEERGEYEGNKLYRYYSNAFSASYKDHFSPRTALLDLDYILRLDVRNTLQMHIFRPVGAQANQLRLKVFSFAESLELSNIVPVLENMGLRVIGEHPYRIDTDAGMVWLHDFNLRREAHLEADIPSVQKNFQAAFLAVVSGEAENDRFNKLILDTRLNWKEVSLLRAYARYMKQLQLPFGINYVAETLVSHPDITRNIIGLFKARLDPKVKRAQGNSSERAERIRNNLIESLDNVKNLDQDRIIRRYIELLDATLRTNFFRATDSGQAYISIKIATKQLESVPEPKPEYEVFVCSPKVEGVHLRSGKVSRGGLRWSDRLQDYRTEILGLVKAQQVKNSVIVPAGAKGGFVARQLPSGVSRSEKLKHGIDCYKIFIEALLDVTDNFVDGEIVHPDGVVCRDGDDPYLVVAADKGTAAFSDIANEIAMRRGYWLGDAFASGGRFGYDHKAMGITALGAWVSVERHFQELGLDVHSERFSVVGIGDMSGDVFGNGMLFSPMIELKAAFNHQHIFVDPAPDVEKSFLERKRLFNKEHSSWSDYNTDVVSAGGDVFSRHQKVVRPSVEVRRWLNINETQLAPDKLIEHLLKAPVDLIWNGGVGTYVKSSRQHHESVGDKSNDGLRVNGNELRCRVFGEGGNLGMTQLGRIEFSQRGGICNTDFIDNAGGVDCSDHEVNIKILLNTLVSAGDMTLKQRNELLRSMTDEVSDLVLLNSFRQAQAVSLECRLSLHAAEEYLSLISVLENSGILNRSHDDIAEDKILRERLRSPLFLTRPELSVLVSHTKVLLNSQLMMTSIECDPLIAPAVLSAFPKTLVERFSNQIRNHRLYREIVINQLSNDIVNRMGIQFVEHLAKMSRAPIDHLVKAYVISCRLLRIDTLWNSIERSANIAAESKLKLLGQLQERTSLGCRWLLGNVPLLQLSEHEIDSMTYQLDTIELGARDLLCTQSMSEFETKYEGLVALGCCESLSATLSLPLHTFITMGVAKLVFDTGLDQQRALNQAMSQSQLLGITELLQRVEVLAVENPWQAIAKDTFAQQIETLLRRLVALTISADSESSKRMERWLNDKSGPCSAWYHELQLLRQANVFDYSMLGVVSRRFTELVDSVALAFSGVAIAGKTNGTEEASELSTLAFQS